MAALVEETSEGIVRMETATQRIRIANMDDCARISEAIVSTLARPDGKGRRGSHSDGVVRNEVLVIERFDRRAQAWKLLGFLEWHTRLDGTVTIRDAGTAGEVPDASVVKALIRELIMSQSPSVLRLKVREDQQAWNQIFAELPGFAREGREYVRPYWRVIWVRERRVGK